jgi:hypothetical protein
MDLRRDDWLRPLGSGIEDNVVRRLRDELLILDGADPLESTSFVACQQQDDHAQDRTQHNLMIATAMLRRCDRRANGHSFSTSKSIVNRANQERRPD